MIASIAEFCKPLIVVCVAYCVCPQCRYVQSRINNMVDVANATGPALLGAPSLTILFFSRINLMLIINIIFFFFFLFFFNWIPYVLR